MTDAIDHAAPDPGRPLRRFLLALVLLGAAGMLVELVLLKHYDSPWQWTPLVLLVLVMATGGAVWRRQTPRTLKLFRALMALCLVAGALGVVLHLNGNLEWIRERDTVLSGWPLVWKMLRGATPILAPGALAQLGLLGLVYAYRHPALSRGAHTNKEIA